MYARATTTCSETAWAWRTLRAARLTIERARLASVRPARAKGFFMRMILFAATALSLVTAPAFAAPCRDTKGKFIKCSEKAAAKPTRCKDTKGKFAKCGTAGAKPV